MNKREKQLYNIERVATSFLGLMISNVRKRGSAAEQTDKLLESAEQKSVEQEFNGVGRWLELGMGAWLEEDILGSGRTGPEGNVETSGAMALVWLDMGKEAVIVGTSRVHTNVTTSQRPTRSQQRQQLKNPNRPLVACFWRRTYGPGDRVMEDAVAGQTTYLLT